MLLFSGSLDHFVQNLIFSQNMTKAFEDVMIENVTGAAFS